MTGGVDTRWRNRPPGSNWGEFGPDDERGRMNLITPERRLRALAEAKEGRVFCLSLSSRSSFSRLPTWSS